MEENVTQMQKWLDKLVDYVSSAGGKIILAVIVFFVGRFIIRKLTTLLKRKNKLGKVEPTLASFIGNVISIGLNIILILTVINILGIPMASVVTVLATAGVAIGMSLQGALSNFCGGVMLMFFRPFSVGDYVSAGGEEGTVKSIALFYTTLTTIDNKRVMIPNGTLMNANITNYSVEKMRRVDLVFTCGRGEDPARIRSLMEKILQNHEQVLKDPAPAAHMTGATNEGMEFTIYAWCLNEDYWPVYYDLLQDISAAMTEAGVSAPSLHVVNS